jgi:hypothetical protein
VYGRKVKDLIYNYINYITNLEFLPVFKVVFEEIFIEKNITAGFYRASLIPFNLDEVILKLDIRLKTPTLSPREELPWEVKTPANRAEIASQTELIKDKVL